MVCVYNHMFDNNMVMIICTGSSVPECCHEGSRPALKAWQRLQPRPHQHQRHGLLITSKPQPHQHHRPGLLPARLADSRGGRVCLPCPWFWRLDAAAPLPWNMPPNASGSFPVYKDRHQKAHGLFALSLVLTPGCCSAAPWETKPPKESGSSCVRGPHRR